MMRKLLTLMVLSTLLLSLVSCAKENSGKDNSVASPVVSDLGDSAMSGGVEAAGGEVVDPETLVKGFAELHIQTLGHISTGQRTPEEDKLTPIWREKTKVIPDVIEVPPGEDAFSWMQRQILADSVPDIIADNATLTNEPTVEALKSANMLKEIKLEDIKRYMPRTAERLLDYGITIEDWYQANIDPTDGKMWVMPSLPYCYIGDAYRDTAYAQERLGSGGYSIWVRDDILKRIYPDAMGAEELKVMAIKNNGELKWEEIQDVPIKNLDDLYGFLKKIKDLNLVEDGKPIIPGHLQYDNTRGGLGTLMTAADVQITDASPLMIDNKMETYVDYQTTPAWKEYISFMNKGFNEGLFGEEFYIQREEQREAKIINGEYACVNLWAPVSANTEKVSKEGKTYGWRLIPIFPKPLMRDQMDGNIQYLSLEGYWNPKAFNANKVSDEMMPQLLNWIDWNYSWEAARLRAWGPPEMSTGENEARRFKPEYKKIEEYMLFGKQDESGDGYYYGMQNRFDNTLLNYEVYGLATADEMADVYSPLNVYPADSDKFNQYDAVNKAWQLHNLKDMDLVLRLAVDDETLEAQGKYLEAKAKAGDVAALYTDQLDNLIVKAISGPVEEFEENYAAYQAVITRSDVVESQKEMFETFKAYTLLRKKFEKKLNA